MFQISEKGDGAILGSHGSWAGKGRRADVPGKICVVHGQQEIKNKKRF